MDPDLPVTLSLGHQARQINKYVSGKISLKDWVASIKMMFTANKTDKQVAIAQVANNLDGPWNGIFRGVAEDASSSSKTIEQILDEFLKATHTENKMLLAYEFGSRTQAPTETSRDFSVNLQQMANDAFVNETNEQIRERVCLQFLQGLSEPIGQSVRCQLPESLDKALSLAVAAETEISRGRNISTTNVMEAIRNCDLAKPRFPGRLVTTRRYNDEKYQTPSRPRPFPRPFPSTTTNTHHIKNDQDKSNTPNSPRDPQIHCCFHCNKPGHIVKNCHVRLPNDPPTTRPTHPESTAVPKNFPGGAQ